MKNQMKNLNRRPTKFDKRVDETFQYIVVAILFITFTFTCINYSIVSRENSEDSSKPDIPKAFDSITLLIMDIAFKWIVILYIIYGY